MKIIIIKAVSTKVFSFIMVFFHQLSFFIGQQGKGKVIPNSSLQLPPV